ncbi:MAG: hypothetical protein WDM92_07795 [Caulobacteraceae bacterium]
MPTQDLKAAPAAPALAAPGHGGATRRDAGRIGRSRHGAGTMIAHVVGPDGVTPLEATVIALVHRVLSGWIGFGFMTALAGFLAALPGGLRAPDGPEAAVPGPHRDPDAGLQRGPRPGPAVGAGDLRGSAPGRRGRALRRLRAQRHRDERIAQAEATGVLRMRSRLGPGGPAHPLPPAGAQHRPQGPATSPSGCAPAAAATTTCWCWTPTA